MWISTGAAAFGVAPAPAAGVADSLTFTVNSTGVDGSYMV